MAHGIQGLVRDDETLVRVSVTVSADGSTARYDPSRLLAFSPGSDVGQAPVGGSLSGGSLSAGSSIEGSLSYVLPRGGEQITLSTGQGLPRIPLIKLDLAPPGAGPGAHDHASGDSAASPTPSSAPPAP